MSDQERAELISRKTGLSVEEAALILSSPDHHVQRTVASIEASAIEADLRRLERDSKSSAQKHLRSQGFK